MSHEKSVVKNRAKVQYEVQRSKNRKRISLRVTDDAVVLVSAPYVTPLYVIDDVVSKNSEWIKTKVALVKQLPSPLPDHTYVTGDFFLVLGEEHSLQVEYNNARVTNCSRNGTTLIVKTRKGAGEVAIRKAIETWYAKFGKELYKNLVMQWISKIEASPKLELTTVEITSYPKRWGSCSQKGELRFALRSLMLPLPIVDYLALHEVAHLYYFNHGPEFKLFLDTYMPDWRERQKTMNMLRRQVAAI